jgi:hypothetical protein
MGICKDRLIFWESCKKAKNSQSENQKLNMWDQIYFGTKIIFLGQEHFFWDRL